MKYYIVVWLAFNCPGGFFGNMMPYGLKQAVCTAKQDSAQFKTLKKAKRKVEKLGPKVTAAIFENKNGKTREIRFEWISVLKLNP